MEVTVHTGATPGNMVPTKVNLTFDLSLPAAHLGERMADVYRAALDYAVDGITAIGIKMATGQIDVRSDLVKVGVGTGGVILSGSLVAGVSEFNDLMSNTHNIPTSSWVSYRNSIDFIGTQNDGDSSPVYLYQMQGGVKVATTAGGMTLTGDGAANSIYGTRKGNLIDGGGGADWLRGGDGNDTILGGDGSDTLQGDAGNDSLNGGGGGTDRMYGGHGSDRMYIYGGDTAEGGVKDAGGAGDITSDQFIFRSDGGRANNANVGAAGYMFDRLVVEDGSRVTTYTLNNGGDLDTFTITASNGWQNVVETDTFDTAPDSVSRTVNQLSEINAMFQNHWADFV